jgi:hypothetical protein
MPTYGYARVSKIDQDLSLQRRTLKAAGCDVIRAEKASGTRRSGRTELEVLLNFLRAGDTLVVTRVDRLARSIRDRSLGSVAKFERTTAYSICCPEPRPHILWLPEILQQSRRARPGAPRQRCRA